MLNVVDQEKIFTVTNMNEYFNRRDEVEQYLLLFSDNNLGLFLIAVNEAFGNAIKHGEFPIQVKIIKNDTTLKVTIKDHGSGFEFQNKLNKISDKSLDDIFEEILYEESGRGIFMMYEICDSIFFEECGTKISLTINLKKY